MWLPVLLMLLATKCVSAFMVLRDPLVRKLEDDLWGGVSAVQRAKSLSQYLNSALLCR